MKQPIYRKGNHIVNFLPRHRMGMIIEIFIKEGSKLVFVLLFSSLILPRHGHPYQNPYSATASPPGAIAGRVYKGVIQTQPLIDFTEADSIKLTSYRPDAVTDLKILEVTPRRLTISGSVGDSARNSVGMNLAIFRGEETINIEFYLNVVSPDWDPAWRPRAVAPADTTVPTDTSDIVLDFTRSEHGGGLKAMHFTWIIDNKQIMKSGPVETITLPRGRHIIELEAEDLFGNRSIDTMIVTVLKDTKH
jgi:hypothetical protein